LISGHGALFPDEEPENAAVLGRFQKVKTGRTAEGVEVFDRAGVRAQDFQRIAGIHRFQVLPGPQDRKRAVQPLSVIYIVSHDLVILEGF